MTDLNNFKCDFSEDISLLNALNIPNLGSFILFSIAFRCLPLSTKKLFESNTKTDFPTVEELMSFVQSRVSVLELVGENRSFNATPSQLKSTQSGQSRKGGDRSRKPGQFTATSLVTTKPSFTCPCCAGTHKLDSCTRFKS